MAVTTAATHQQSAHAHALGGVLLMVLLLLRCGQQKGPTVQAVSGASPLTHPLTLHAGSDVSACFLARVLLLCTHRAAHLMSGVAAMTAVARIMMTAVTAAASVPSSSTITHTYDISTATAAAAALGIERATHHTLLQHVLQQAKALLRPASTLTYSCLH
jgi:hypothetical protein